MSGSDEAARLEALWAGDFGDAYVARNLDAERGRQDFWQQLLGTIDAETALEVGCNVGANLRWILDILGQNNVTGVDVNAKALGLVRERFPGVDARLAPGRALPFDEASYDLVFTMGVLIHLPIEDLHSVMTEIVRCSCRYVLCGEYFAQFDVEVPYRGQREALFKRNYGGLYLELFPELREIDRGFLPKGDGPWDDLTYWVFEKRG